MQPWRRKRQSWMSGPRRTGTISFQRSRGKRWRRKKGRKNWRKSTCCLASGAQPKRYSTSRGAERLEAGAGKGSAQGEASLPSECCFPFSKAG